MKKILLAILIVLFGAMLTAGYLVYSRYSQNPEQIFPYPYTFSYKAPSLKVEAPILIIGDRMGAYFAKFKTELAATISSNLAQPIAIESMAKEGHALHRTLHELKSLTRWPQILVYQGASEEFSERKFEPSEIPKVRLNFDRYRDDRIETAMILAPWLSRIIYEPMKRINLGQEPQLLDEVSEEEYMKRLETELLLFEQELIQLVNLSKDRNALLILTTTPINLDIAPKKVCSFAQTDDLNKEILDLRELLKANNPKAAFSRSTRLVESYSGNAELFFVQGQIARRLGDLETAKAALLQASAFDCSPWRTTEVHNTIIRRVSRQLQVPLFDFAKLVEGEWTFNVTFFDELHPQNLYYEQGMNQLGLVIKKILKL